MFGLMHDDLPPIYDAPRRGCQREPAAGSMGSATGTYLQGSRDSSSVPSTTTDMEQANLCGQKSGKRLAQAKRSRERCESVHVLFRQRKKHVLAGTLHICLALPSAVPLCLQWGPKKQVMLHGLHLNCLLYVVRFIFVPGGRLRASSHPLTV